MNDKRTQLTARCVHSLHGRVWLLLGEELLQTLQGERLVGALEGRQKLFLLALVHLQTDRIGIGWRKFDSVQKVWSHFTIGIIHMLRIRRKNNHFTSGYRFKMVKVIQKILGNMKGPECEDSFVSYYSTFIYVFDDIDLDIIDIQFKIIRFCRVF